MSNNIILGKAHNTPLKRVLRMGSKDTHYPTGRPTHSKKNYQLAVKNSYTGPKKASKRRLEMIPPSSPTSRSRAALKRAREKGKSMEMRAQSTPMEDNAVKGLLALSRAPTRHTGGLIHKTGPHRLLKGEIVLSRAQRKGFTHGQIVKILAKYR